MNMLIENIDVKIICACGYEEFIHIGELIPVEDLEDWVNVEAEEQGWNFGECPECCKESLKESRGCFDLHDCRDYGEAYA